LLGAGLGCSEQHGPARPLAPPSGGVVGELSGRPIGPATGDDGGALEGGVVDGGADRVGSDGSSAPIACPPGEPCPSGLCCPLGAGNYQCITAGQSCL